MSEEKVIVQEHSIDMKNVELSERREIQNVEDGIVTRHTKKSNWVNCDYEFEYTVIEKREKGHIKSTEIHKKTKVDIHLNRDVR